MSKFNSQQHSRKTHNDKGATIVEILLTIALLALISSVFMQVLIDSIELRLVGAEYTKANKVANAYADSIKNYTGAPATGIDSLVNFKNSGFDIKATWTNESNSVDNGSTGPIGQLENNKILTPNFSIELSNSSLKVQPQTGSQLTYDISNLENNTITWSHAFKDETTNTSTIKLKTPSAVAQILGNSVGTTVLRVKGTPQFSKPIQLIAENNTNAEMVIQIFDDPSERIQVVDMTTSGKLTIVSGLITETVTGSSATKYYTVKIEIFKGSKRVTELMSSITLN